MAGLFVAGFAVSLRRSVDGFEKIRLFAWVSGYGSKL
jgi:hypothetical protein